MPRDSSGAYTLPSGNPVVDGTVIESDWANDTMEDIAVQMNNVFTRDGLLGPIAPVLFVNGTVSLPGIAFQESPSTGIYRVAPNTVGLAIAGVARQTWTPTVSTITGNLTVTGTITGSGAISFVGPVLIDDGTALLPAYSFTADPNTGVYRVAADQLGFSTGGLLRAHVSSVGKLTIEPVSTISEPDLLIKSPATNGLSVDIQGEATTNLSTIRFLNNAYNQVRLQILSNDTTNVVGGNTALPLQFFTNSINRVTISATGAVTFATPTSGAHAINGTLNITGTTQVSGAFGASADIVGGGNIYAFNHYINPGTATAAGTWGIPSGLGGAMVTWGTAAVGTGNIDFTSDGSYLFRLVRIASAVNYLQLNNASVGTGPNLSAVGSDANVQFNYFSKGNGVHAFFTNNVAQFVVIGVASAANYVAVSGATAGNNPTIGVSGGFGLRVPGAAFQVIGGGRPWSGAVTESQGYLYNVALGICNFTATANNRIHEWYKDGSALYGLWISDNGGAASEWLRATGGQATGTTSIAFTAVAINLGSTTGGVNITSSATSNGALTVTDLGAAGANIKMTGNNGAASKPQKFIRACADDFQVLNHAYNLALLTIGEQNANGSIISDHRGLQLARDPGATVTAQALTIGSIVIGSPGGAVNALTGTVTPSGGSPMTVFATGAGANASITFGTWRNCGALSSSSAVALWIRTA